MQLSVATLLLLNAIFSILIAALFANQHPMNSTSAAVVWVGVVLVASIWFVGALGSYLGWRRMFWGAFILLAWVGVGGAVTDVQALQDRAAFPILTWELVVRGVMSLGALGLLMWMWRGNSVYGPWATYKRRITRA